MKTSFIFLALFLLQTSLSGASMHLSASKEAFMNYARQLLKDDLSIQQLNQLLTAVKGWGFYSHNTGDVISKIGCDKFKLQIETKIKEQQQVLDAQFAHAQREVNALREGE